MGHAGRSMRAHTSTGLIKGREEINVAGRCVADAAVSSLIGPGPLPATSVHSCTHKI